MRLEHCGLPQEPVWIAPKSLPEWVAGASPHGRVPVLVVAGTPSLESVAIAELIEGIGGARVRTTRLRVHRSVPGWSWYPLVRQASVQ